MASVKQTAIWNMVKVVFTLLVDCRFICSLPLLHSPPPLLQAREQEGGKKYDAQILARAKVSHRAHCCFVALTSLAGIASGIAGWQAAARHSGSYIPQAAAAEAVACFIQHTATGGALHVLPSDSQRRQVH
jgi:hypothetical protein